MPITTALLLKLAASAGTATLSKLLENEDGGPAQAINSILGGVATSYIHQYSDKLDYKSLSRFITQKAGEGYKSENHDIEKLMLASVPKTFKLLKETYQKEFETEKGALKFFDHLEKQAFVKPNDERDYELMAKSQTDWLEQNTKYAWQFAELFAQQEGIDLDNIYADHIKEFLNEHFDRAYDVVFTEGLKYDKNEKPLKAFMIKSLRAIEDQTKDLETGQAEILKAIKELREKEDIDISESRNYFDAAYKKKEERFQKRVITFLKRIDRRVIELGRKLDLLLKEKLGLIYPFCLTLPSPRIDFDKYVERGDFLETIKKDMTDGKKTLLLNGMGGVGKSTLAAAYLRRFEDDYEHVAWLSQTDNFENMFISALVLQQSLDIKPSEQTPKEIVSSLLLELKKVEGKRLLVLDNVDVGLGEYHHLLPQGWHILLTSREKLSYDFSIKRVDNLSFMEAKELVDKHYTKAPYTDKELKELCDWVDYHALTLELFSKTLEESLDLETIAELCTYLKENKLDADDLQEKVFTSHSKEEVTAYTHLIQSFTLAKLDENEIWTLLQFAVLPPLGHEYKDLLEWLSIKGEDKKAFSTDLKNLAKKGWLEREGSSFSMHRMVQTLVRHQEKPNQENTKELIETFTQKLSIDQTKDNPIDKFQWIEYGKFIFNSLETRTLEEKVSTLANNLATVLEALGDYEGAKTLLEKALKSDEANFGEKHPNVAVSYSNLALVLQALGDYEGAKTLLEKALKSDEANFGEKHPNVAVSYSNLALVLQALGDYEGAKTLLEKALKSVEANFGEKHPTTAVHYSNLALVLQALGDYEGAKTLLEKALKSVEANFGEKHPTTAVSYSNLATVLKDLGDYEGAKTLLEKALKSDEANFGEKHPSTARTQSNLALVLTDLEDYEGAKSYLEKALKSVEANFGEKHPTTAVSYSNLALVLQALGDYEGAKSYLEKALKSDEANFGEKHPSTARTQSNLATVLQALGDYEGAKSYLEKALKSDEANFGEKHPTTAVRYHNYGALLDTISRPCEGLKWCQKAYEIFKDYLGENHPNTRTVKSWVDALTEKCNKQKPQSLD